MNTRTGWEYTKIKSVTFVGWWRILFFLNFLCFHTELCAFLMPLGRAGVRLVHKHSRATCWYQAQHGTGVPPLRKLQCSRRRQWSPQAHCLRGEWAEEVWRRWRRFWSFSTCWTLESAALGNSLRSATLVPVTVIEALVWTHRVSAFSAISKLHQRSTTRDYLYFG